MPHHVLVMAGAVVPLMSGYYLGVYYVGAVRRTSGVLPMFEQVIEWTSLLYNVRVLASTGRLDRLETGVVDWQQMYVLAYTWIRIIGCCELFRDIAAESAAAPIYATVTMLAVGFGISVFSAYAIADMCKIKLPGMRQFSGVNS